MKLLLQVIIILVVIWLISALDNYQFNEGINASINFTLELEYSLVAFEMFTLNSEQPFYTNKALNPLALLPDQRGRFKVGSFQTGSNFTVQLNISNIQQMDEGVYIVIVQEINGGQKGTYFGC